MKISAPIITLLAGGALAGGLVVANGVSAANTGTPTAAAQVSGQTGTDDDAAASSAGDKKAADKAAGGTSEDEDQAPGAAAAGNPATGTPGGATAAKKENVRRTYAGRVAGAGHQPLLAISVRDGVAVAYICDGKLEAWLKGTASDGHLSLKGDDGAKLTASFSATRAKGSVTVGNKTWEFVTPVVKKPSGLYKATAKVRGAKVQGGWVVLADGDQVGLVRRDGAPATAPVIDTATGRTTIDGQVLTAVAADPDSGAGF
jgi:serine/threonine-protein kinase